MVVKLAADRTVLRSVIVEENRSDRLESISVKKKEVDKLSLVTSSIGSLTEQLSGVSTLKTGSNVSKPIVHGLHSNRVLVMNDGVRHAYQAWGEEHAPEIDPSRIGQIEIVKGAATVKYGPEALGGVILYNSEKPIFNAKINGSIGSSYQTNGRAYSSQVSISQGFQRFAWNANGFGIYQGDMRAPDYNLSNTGKREYGGSFNTLVHYPKFDLEVTGSYFEQEFGILRASIVGNLVDLQNAIDDSIPQPTFPKTYDIQNPRQETKHALLRTNLSVFTGAHIFNIQYAFQNNIRREYDVRRGQLNERPVIFLDLISHTLETNWIQPEIGKWNGSSGVQVFTKNSINEPESNPANFVPDYDIFNFGAYTTQSVQLGQTTFEIGARFDLQSLKVADTIRDLFIYNNELNFFNATFMMGIKRKINKSLTLFSNIGSAWRPPNVAELYAFGYRYSRMSFGLWRYELTPQIVMPINSVFDKNMREVPSEKSYKWVSGFEWRNSRFNSEFILYRNLINDYIYLRPFGITINVAGTFPFFIYEQTNALLIGVNWDVQYTHSKYFSSELKLSYVYGWERKNSQPLIEVPPLNIDYSFHKKVLGVKA